MTDRYHALTVVLERDVRSDDAEAIIDAIKMVKGVVSVRTHVVNLEDYSARVRVKSELLDGVLKLFQDK